MAHPITIGTSAIRGFDGLYSLNDLHQAAGGEKKHQPANFLRLDTTVELAKEICSSDVRNIAFKTIQGRGKNQGTYVCKELVYAYAMWISPKFNLAVIRAFDAIQQGEIPAAPKPQLLPPLSQQFQFERWNGSSQLPVQKCALIERRRDGIVTITTSECKKKSATTFADVLEFLKTANLSTTEATELARLAFSRISEPWRALA